MKLQRVIYDLADALKFLRRQVSEPLRFFERMAVLHQVEKVAKRFQGIVHFVRHGGHQAARHRQVL